MSKLIRRMLTKVRRSFNTSAMSHSMQVPPGFARELTAKELEKRLGSVDGTGLDDYYAARWKCHRLWG